jgi:hypothetical protein
MHYTLAGVHSAQWLTNPVLYNKIPESENDLSEQQGDK